MGNWHNMPTKEKVSLEIQRFEGFAVRIRPAAGTTEKSSLKSYTRNHERIARQSFSVADWKRRRFDTLYPSHEVDVLLANGKPAPPRT
ncbi:MAG TPA: hypothetical protein VNR65_10180, partial [Geobacterales bacterium]|nr:hypothetical protein [Geobacterales bacterium]